MAPGPRGPGFRLPYFFMEYLENGTLGRFQERIKGVQKLRLPSGEEIPFFLPNRLLWAVFLCCGLHQLSLRSTTGTAWLS